MKSKRLVVVCKAKAKSLWHEEREGARTKKRPEKFCIFGSNFCHNGLRICAVLGL